MITNQENESIKCGFMEAMGFNIEADKWQDQYKKRQRIA